MSEVSFRFRPESRHKNASDLLECELSFKRRTVSFSANRGPACLRRTEAYGWMMTENGGSRLESRSTPLCSSLLSMKATFSEMAGGETSTALRLA